MDGLFMGNQVAVPHLIGDEREIGSGEWSVQQSLDEQMELGASLSTFLRDAAPVHSSTYGQLPDDTALAAALLRGTIRRWCDEQLQEQKFTWDSLTGLALAIGDFSDADLLSFARGLE